MANYIFPDQLDPKVVSTETLPTVSGMVPTWNEDLDGYYPQVPFTNELLGKPLTDHPVLSGQVLRWQGTYWKPTTANSMTGPIYKRATKVGRQTLNSKTPVKLTGMSVTISIEEGDALELTGFINIIQGSACTPWIGYSVDSGTRVSLGARTKNSGWWDVFPIETTIFGLSAGTHTIDIWGATDGTTYVEAGTSAWYTFTSAVSEFTVIRVKGQT